MLRKRRKVTPQNAPKVYFGNYLTDGLKSTPSGRTKRSAADIRKANPPKGSRLTASSVTATKPSAVRPTVERTSETACALLNQIHLKIKNLHVPNPQDAGNRKRDRPDRLEVRPLVRLFVDIDKKVRIPAAHCFFCSTMVTHQKKETLQKL